MTDTSEESSSPQTLSESTSSEDDQFGPFIDVCSVSEIGYNQGKQFKVDSRELAIFNARGSYYAMDHYCYHMGGPLSSGDIEDINGRSCVVCPWHKYIITLDTGEGLYKKIDPANPKAPSCMSSKGLRQRVHRVKVDNTTNRILVGLSIGKEKLPSDHYHNIILQSSQRMKEAGLVEPQSSSSNSSSSSSSSSSSNAGVVAAGIMPNSGVVVKYE